MKQQCPKCGTDFVQRIRPDGVLERLACLLFIYPFRCQLCTHRFRAFLPSAAVLGQKPQHLIRYVAAMIVERARVGMRKDDRRVRHADRVQHGVR